jgi:indolepyruvate ferredoxin oxidoreductase alpha subunit
MGNQALALGALKAGVSIVSGYPGTPSTEVLETIAAEVAARGLTDVHVEWSTNEKTALEVGAGAAFAGARALVTMKQVGLNVASDALMSLSYLGVTGGLVLIVADDPGPISSQTEQDTRQYAAFAKVPVFDPSTPEEAFEMVRSAFELSERYKTPVIVRPTTRVCHGTAPLELEAGFTRDAHNVEGFERNSRWVVFPRRAFEGHQEIIERLKQVAAEFDESAFNTLHNTSATAPAHLGIVAGGISYAYVHDALVELKTVKAGGFTPATRTSAFAGLTPATRTSPLLGAFRLFKVGTPFPFPEKRALEFLEGLREVLVFEELEPVIERELLQLVGKHHLPTKVLGKLTGHTPQAGEMSVSAIAKHVIAFLNIDVSLVETESTSLAPESTSLAPPPLPARPPVLCAGCPHRASFFAVKRALRGRKAVFSGDIGCYTLGNALPLDMVDTCVCMGAGLTIPQGMNWAEPDVLHLGFVGDSTFFASGLTGVVNAVYNHSKITLCILDNSTTAMTGSQPHPGTGIRMDFDAHTTQTRHNDAKRALRIPEIVRALGVEHVVEVNPFELEDAIEAVRAAVDFDGVSALIFKAPCITVAAPKPQPVISAEACTNCKRCIHAIGCPALVIRKERVTIDETQCYGCKLCVALCPFNAIITPSTDGERLTERGAADGAVDGTAGGAGGTDDEAVDGERPVVNDE